MIDRSNGYVLIGGALPLVMALVFQAQGATLDELLGMVGMGVGLTGLGLLAFTCLASAIGGTEEQGSRCDPARLPRG